MIERSLNRRVFILSSEGQIKAAHNLLEISTARHKNFTRYAAEDLEWTQRYMAEYPSQFDGEGTLSDSFIAMAAGSTLTAAKLVHEYRRPLHTLKKMYGYEDPDLRANNEPEARIDMLLDAERFGVSLPDIFDNGKKLVQEKPVEVYGYTLLSTVAPSNAEDVANGVHAFMPITACSPDELRRFSKQDKFPVQTSATLIELSSLYQRALRAVRASFYDPDSPRFPTVARLYEEIVQTGTPFQFGLFLEQVIGVNTKEQGRYAYTAIKDLIEQGKQANFYQEFIGIIEDSFEGTVSEELYELMNIERDPEAECNKDTWDAVLLKRRRLLKLQQDAAGEVCLSPGEYGSLSLKDPMIKYRKNKSNTHVSLQATIEGDNGQDIPMFFCALEDDYFWSFLGDHETAPEPFNVIVQAVDEAFGQALCQIEQPLGADRSESPSPSKEHYKDPIYELRKVCVQEAVGRLAVAHSEAKEAAKPSVPTGQPLAVDFPDSVASTLPDDIRSKAEVAIDKYLRGLPNIRPVRSLSVDGREVFRLRSSDVRVLAEKKGQRLEVIGAGPRKTIYGS